METLFKILHEPFVQTGLWTSLLLGGLCAFLGIFLVLKRIVFVGAAMSQLAALGVALGHLLGHGINFSPDVAAFIFAVAGAVIFWLPFSNKRLSKESWIGYVYALAGSAAIIVIAKDPLAKAENLDLISGNLLYVSNEMVLVLLAVVVGLGLLHLLFHKEFMFVSFDPETARSLGLPARFYEFLLYLSLGITVAVGIKMAGLLYVFSSLIVPAVIGLRLFGRLPLAIIAAVASIFIASVAGMLLSYVWDLPSAPTISVVNALLLFPALLLKK